MALSPSGETFGNYLRQVITSTPFTQDGIAWDWYKKAQNREEGHQFVMVFQLATWEMNPHAQRDSDRLIMAAYALDHNAAEVEYGAQWVQAAGDFLPREAVLASYAGRSGANLFGDTNIRYSLHLDLSKKHDSLGIAITHYDKVRNKVVLDLVEEFDPSDKGNPLTSNLGEIDMKLVYDHVVNELAGRRRFRFNCITTDQYNSLWLIQELRKKFGDWKGDWIYELTATDKSNRQIYDNLRGLFVQGAIETYPHEPAIKQLLTIAKVTKPNGNYKIEAPPGYKDDMADAITGATVEKRKGGSATRLRTTVSTCVMCEGGHRKGRRM